MGLSLTPVMKAWGQTPIPKLNLQQALPSLSNFAANQVATGEVTLDGYDLFAIAAPALTQQSEKTNTSPIRERIKGIEDTLKRIANSNLDPSKVQVTTEIDGNSNLPVIYVNDQYLMTVTTLDAQLQVQQPERWAEQLTPIIKQALIRAHQERQPDFLMQQAAIGTGIVLVMLVLSAVIIHWQKRLKQRRERIEREILAEPTIGAQPASEAADTTTAIATIQQQRTKQQHRDLKGLQTRFLHLTQFVIWIGGMIFLLGLFPYTRWLQPLVLATPLRILGIILGVYILMRLSDVLIERFLSALSRGNFLYTEASQRLELRVATFSRVFKSGAAVIWVVIGLLASLSVVGVNLLPLLAGAGIIGLAISFAAQSLVKDMINGFLILFEDQYAVGDVIIVGNVSGFVENMNLRITQLRDSEGQLITVPNSSISVVQNLSKDWSRVDLAIDLAYGTNPDHALNVIRHLSEEMYNDPEWNSKMPEPPEVLGIDELNHTGILIRVWIKTLPLQQWAVAREFRRRLTLRLAEADLTVGVPQQSIWFRSSLDLEERFDSDRPATKHQRAINNAATNLSRDGRQDKE
ncbi:mechanosensitive ion channel family protein [Pantanalinema sp. GBBB05]|uniref:mechanosensitive ion channel family protein n=1 Tax=Pantanalinema sp. GBBB05 TaxID=2604139 RepID=UPI001D601C16|nr:mechanosensitive ion channel family protein [Pantanalinema sp. GBBB05]